MKREVIFWMSGRGGSRGPGGQSRVLDPVAEKQRSRSKGCGWLKQNLEERRYEQQNFVWNAQSEDSEQLLSRASRWVS